MYRYHVFYHKKNGLDVQVGHESIYNSNQGERDLMVRAVQLLAEDADICVIFGEDITARIKESL